MNAPSEQLGGARRRRHVFAGARGDVLEVGIGTGRNLTHYPKEWMSPGSTCPTACSKGLGGGHAGSVETLA